MFDDPFSIDYDRLNVWHVYPEDDIDEHSIDGDAICHCHPHYQVQENGALLITHHAFDRRELYEEGNPLYNQIH